MPFITSVTATKDRLFVGEAAGNYLTVNGLDYLRPATPPRFFLDLFLKSIDRLLALEDQPICYAHFGEASNSHRMLNIFRDQLILWEAIIGEMVRRGGNKEDIIRSCVELLLEKDPNLAAFSIMDPDIQAREKVFMANGIRGFVEFLKEKTTQLFDGVQLFFSTASFTPIIFSFNCFSLGCFRERAFS